jgi:hypothetical protein
VSTLHQLSCCHNMCRLMNLAVVCWVPRLLADSPPTACHRALHGMSGRRSVVVCQSTAAFKALKAKLAAMRSICSLMHRMSINGHVTQHVSG